MQKIDYLQEKINNILNELNSVINDLNNIKNKNIEHFEILYDKDSDDEKLNWGYKNGIKGGTTVSGRDFSKYKEIIVYTVVNYDRGKFYIDLTTLNGYARHYGSCCNPRVDSGTYYAFGSKATVAEDKTDIKFTFYRNSTSMDNKDAFYSYKIVGILKNN